MPRIPAATADPAREAQCAGTVLMVRPANFGFNAQTAASNTFQRAAAGGAAEAQALALREFAALAAALRGAGVEVIVADDTPAPVKPDAVFPNNWVSFHADGSIVLYPLLAANRRLERRAELIDEVIRAGRFRVSRSIDLSYRERDGQYLEGTGSLVLDRPGRIAYASLSPRTDLDVLGEFAQQLDYELVTFESRGADGTAVYHTNVVMAVGARFAVVCGEAIVDARHRLAVCQRLEAGGHRLVDISSAQMHGFAGNLLELAGASGPVIALSAAAWSVLGAQQRRVLESHGEIVAVDVATIERVGGGGVRCMLAEIHLPKRRPAAG